VTASVVSRLVSDQTRGFGTPSPGLPRERAVSGPIASIAAIIFLILLTLAGQPAQAQDVRISVFGLFHPRQVTVSALPGSAIVLNAGKDSFVLEASSGSRTAAIRLASGGLLLQVGTEQTFVTAVHAASRGGSATDFMLSVPGKISRRYHGTLDVAATRDSLLLIVNLGLETAVASVVLAESLPGTPIEALKAQAVAARSYFVAATGRHRGFDFCDTTHCQYLRQPPAPQDPASLAANSTRGLVLSYHGEPFAAMYTRSCGGRTRTLQEIGVSNGVPGGVSSYGYPYFTVACDYCLRHPWRWSRRISEADLIKLQAEGEAGRLQINRRLGEAVPSCSFTAHPAADGVLIEGVGQGHGVGLCQSGARAMAQAGVGFRDILRHFYPDTEIGSFKVRVLNADGRLP